MNADPNRAKAIFLEAVEQHEAAQWPAFLDQSCADQPELRRRVEVLLEAHREAGTVGHRAGGDQPMPSDDNPATERPGTVIGPYKLLEQIGEGGFGIVFMAEQQQPLRRKVALKVLKPGMDSRQVVARFEAERQALALMDHPNIAHVFDGGETALGRPFFVMELVRGVPITAFCDQNHLSVRERLGLFVDVCQAVQHAHQKGIIHRDLKPTNVLVTLHDDKAVVKVIDFGVAKATGQQLTNKTLFTNFAQMIGTPLYMSPEQAQMSGLDVDTRTDVYALGVLLYELLTGTTPFDGERLRTVGYDEMRRIIREEEPARPSTRMSTLGQAAATVSADRGSEPRKLSALFRGELDWIVMKALEKDRNRRYATANAFAADVQCYLNDEPVQACPPSAGYRLRKFTRRHKRALAMVAVAAVAVLIAATTLGWSVRDREARELEISRVKARRLALSEQGIRLALDRGARNSADLHANLKQPGGVQLLLNQPARWELYIKTAQGELEQARRIADRAEGGLDTKWTLAMDRLEEQLTLDQAEYALAVRLEKIRQETETFVDGRFDLLKAADEYPKAFAGFAMLRDEPGRVAARLSSSPIKDQFVAALDDWAWVAFQLHQHGTAEQLLALARQTAPDPAWGDRLRQLKVWRDPEALGKLVAEAPATRLSPQLLVLVGLLLNAVDSPLMESWLRKAQAEHPADFWLNYIVGYALYRANHVEAAGFFRVAIAVRPRNAAAYTSLGHALAYDQSSPKDLPEAIAAYRKAIEIDPKYADAYHSIGTVLCFQNKELGEATAAFRKAAELDPKNPLTLNMLAWLLATNPDPKLRDPSRALELAKQALEIAPEDGESWKSLGAAQYSLGDWKAAITAFEKANTFFDGGGSKEWFFIAKARWQLRETDQARQAYDRGAQWMDKYHPNNEELRRLRAEAAELLGVKE